MKIRYHLDENVHHGIALGLRSYQIDVTTTIQSGLIAAFDTAQLHYASSNGRVLVTHDNDFCTLHASSPQHGGLVYCHQQKYSVGDLLKALVLLFECYDSTEMLGRIEFI